MSPSRPQDTDYRRTACDQILDSLDGDSLIAQDEFEEPSGTSGHPSTVDTGGEGTHLEPLIDKARLRRVAFIRMLALLCACSLSIGSHYATNILGPLKSRLHRELGTSNTQFGLLLAAYSLNSTWTPLVGGVLASRLGTTYTSILATGIIFTGQLLLLLGDILANVELMALGLFVFGFGVSPLAVVQETIIVRFFRSHSLGVSMAFGLIAGKGASFLSARTTYPLTERFGPRAPFYVATALAGLSVVTNLVYVASSQWLVDGAEAELEAPDISMEAHRRLKTDLSGAEALKEVAEKRKVHLGQVTKLGDVFWAYIALNLFCGMIWSPFTHLAANIIERRFSMSEEDAANSASYLLAGSLVLYPVVRTASVWTRIITEHRPVIMQLLALSSALTLSSYVWLAISPHYTKTPIPAITCFALGHGFSPLLLVVLVPRIVPLKYVATTLGVHKSMEQTGSTLFQTLAGLLLDVKQVQPGRSSLQYLLNSFVALNCIQFGTIFLLAYLPWRKGEGHSQTHHVVLTSEAIQRVATDSSLEETTPLLGPPGYRRRQSSHGPTEQVNISLDLQTRSERRRGRFMGFISIGLVVTAWVLFLTTSWYKLGHTKTKLY